jgi:hypothetical protein
MNSSFRLAICLRGNKNKLIWIALGFSNKVFGNRVTINPENLNGAALYG